MRDRMLSGLAFSGACALLWIVTGSAPAQAQKLHSSLSVDLHLHYGTGKPHRYCPPPRRDDDDWEWRHHHHHWRKHPVHRERDHDEDDWDGPRHDRGRHLGWEHAPGHLRKEGRDRDDH
ncbi:MAG TPA: hypothetical protein VFA07_00190 [Chthonomonadaceae bacterium]|nr:hypothetical protein [Chthonomonadaceae bacterium]